MGRAAGLSALAAVPVCQAIGRSRRVHEIFVTSGALRKELGDDEFERLPTGALGLYTYFERLDQGLRQLMAGSRKFTTSHLSRNDLAALTREAAEISGIQYVMEADQDEVERLFSA